VALYTAGPCPSDARGGPRPHEQPVRRGLSGRAWVGADLVSSAYRHQAL